jgi:hypothetical protein
MRRHAVRAAARTGHANDFAPGPRRFDNFQFNWHLSYIYADDVAPLLPAGTILHVRSWIDNTAANRANPDPTQWVGYGQRSIDEMTHAWVNIVYLDDEDFKQLEVERKTKQAPTLTAQF